MKILITVLILIVSNSCYLFSQKETANWVLSPNSLLNFNFSPPVLTYTYPFVTAENSASISDPTGNLLFYTDGDTVRSANGIVLPNGEDLSYIQSSFLNSTTQGSLIIQKPNSSNLYYVFSLGGNVQQQMLLSYSIIDKNLNSGLGAVVSKYNKLCLDTLAEKLTATKHCNKKDIWIVVVKCVATRLWDGEPIEYLTEFQSYLLTENGIQPTPVRTILNTKCRKLGQMKFNNIGDELAFADGESLTLLSFDKSSGKFSLKSEMNLPLGNGYGIEYAPNDKLIYINEKQYDLNTNTLTSIYNNKYPSQLQRGLDGKIYMINQSASNATVDTAPGILKWSGANDFLIYGRQDSSLRISVIENPDISGIGCQYNPNYVSLVNALYFNKITMSLPNFPSFYFNYSISDFTYIGTCPAETFQFFLSDPNIIPDSVHWIFHDSGYEVTSTNPTYVFPMSGEYQVTCIVYINGIPSYSTQCVNVCGPNNISLPEKIDLCKVTAPFELNALNTCSAEYLWSTGDTVASILVKNEGIYTLQTTNSCGVYSYSVEVFKGDDCTVLTEIPNIITVNDDQTNDVFSIKVKNAKSFSYSIINRWGNLLTKGEITVPQALIFDWNSFNLWNGKTEKGEFVTDGTYFYVIDFMLFDDSRSSKNGFLEVIK